MLVQLLLLCALLPEATPEAGLQLAVVFDSSVHALGAHEAEDQRPSSNILSELAALEDGLHGHEAEIAFVDCLRDQGQARGRVLADFGHPGPRAGLVAQISGLPGKHGRCLLNADVVGTAVSQLSWQVGSRQRILIISREHEAIRSGRQTLEQVMRNAEHAGIVVHGLSVSDGAGSFAAENIMRDIQAFMKSPTAPTGRPAHHLRQGVLITGGRYYVSVKMRPKALKMTTYSGVFGSLLTRWDRSFSTSTVQCIPACKEPPDPTPEEIRSKLSTDLKIEAAYGLQPDLGLDVLDKLASGELRPSEISLSQLPSFLHGHNLEPLLDPVWDFVNARRAIQQILNSASLGFAAKGVVPPLAGHALAKDILGPARFAPSRR